MDVLTESLAKLWQDLDAPPNIFDFLQRHACVSPDGLVPLILLDQRHRWKTDRPLRVEDYLGNIPHLSGNPQFALELAIGEFEAQSSCGLCPDMEEFIARFPDIRERLRRRLTQFATLSPSAQFGGTSQATIEVADSSSGSKLGRYQLQSILGEGTFGRVHLAFDEELERQVAIKVPAPARFQKPEDALQYLSEARTVAGLDHPHIVPVYDMGRTEDGSIYVVSKYIEGESLEARLRFARPDHDCTAKWIATIALALHYAHERRLIHRDVKPANILLEGDASVPYVADFGLAVREEDFLRDMRVAGTPAYMSPEQVRGEGHRLDGRSDVFSLGVVLYECLTGRRPFHGVSLQELAEQITTVEPTPPRMLDKTVSADLERICLRALGKRVSDRYRTAMEMADDLLHCNQQSRVARQEISIVPKGLRSFEAEDADFFLSLLPGPINRHGLPKSIEFWKSRIEELDPDQTFLVGLLYGPSGCGKSSLIKAGLLPRLSPSVVTVVYLEATLEDTESRLLCTMRKILPELPKDLCLVSSFAWLRQRPLGHPKVIVFIDQFEQWLHSHNAVADSELVAALRQCDGSRLQAIVMVRDDFAMAAARFMDAIDIPIVQGHNFATVDLFDLDHARNVLQKFGQAFGKLPAHDDALDNDADLFLTRVVEGLSDEGKVVSVQVALFAEMVKNRPWKLDTLMEIGGTEGVGVNFLEESFVARSANPSHKQHLPAVRKVLRALLPEWGSNLKGHMQSRGDLIDAADYSDRPKAFHNMLRILDGELRLITPTDHESDTPGNTSERSSSDPQYYQLTHDYLVPAIRRWLTQKQQETASGRAELRLSEWGALWNDKPEKRYLPPFGDWVRIRWLTPSKRWRRSERRMMRQADRLHVLRFSAVVVALFLFAIGGMQISSAVQNSRANAEASRLVDGLLGADANRIGDALKDLTSFRTWADPKLREAYAVAEEGSGSQLRAALALMSKDEDKLQLVKDRLLDLRSEEFRPVRDLLEPLATPFLEEYWEIATNSRGKPEHRFRAAAALAKFASQDQRWEDPPFAEFVTDQLVATRPSEFKSWRSAFFPVREYLFRPLAAIYRDPAQSPQRLTFASDALVNYMADDLDQLCDLLLDGQAEQFAVLYPTFETYGDQAIAMLQKVLNTPLEVEWSDSSLNASWGEPDDTLVARIESAEGIVALHFAFCQTLPLEDFPPLADAMGEHGYRPVKLRPFRRGDRVLAAAVWKRDGRAWRVETDRSAEAIQQRDAELRQEGFAAIDVAGYEANSETPRITYIGLWEEAEAAQDVSRLYAGIEEANFEATCESLQDQGFPSLQSIQIFYPADGVARYAVVGSKGTSTNPIPELLTKESFTEKSYPGLTLWDLDLSTAPPLPVAEERSRAVLAKAEQQLESDPEDLEAVQLRAISLYQLGRDEGAMRDFSTLIDEKSQGMDAYLYRAICYARNGNTLMALKDLYFANITSPRAMREYPNVSVLAYMGQEDAAVERLEAAIAEWATDDRRLYDAACAYSLASQAYKEQDSAKHKRYTQRAVELLGRAIALGYTNDGYGDASGLAREGDLDPIRSADGFRKAITSSESTLRYAAVLNPSAKYRAKMIHDLDSTAHLQRCRDLAAEGYRPVSVSAAVVENEVTTGSVWHQPRVSLDERLRWSRRRANAAAALARLSRYDSLIPLLRIADNPETQVQFIHRCRVEGVTQLQLLECLRRADQGRQFLKGDARIIEDRVIHGLLLALGEFNVDGLSESQRAPLLKMVGQWYQDDPSSAVHGAAGWLLRRWGQNEVVRRIDQTPVAYSSERQWFTLAIPAGEETFYQTYVVIPPGTYLIGSSPWDDTERARDEALHRVRLSRPFAMLNREVTRREFEASGVVELPIDEVSPSGEHPMVAQNWFESVLYCRWLTDQYGLGESEQAYVDGATIFAMPRYMETPFPREWPVNLEAGGFRLPTEAEWEIAARGGIVSPYAFGWDHSLAKYYRWFKENSRGQTHKAFELKPNYLGLFDMHGNTSEWCQDWYGPYDTGDVLLNPVVAGYGIDRVGRGGRFSDSSEDDRLAERDSTSPLRRYSDRGLRLCFSLTDVHSRPLTGSGDSNVPTTDKDDDQGE